MHQLVSATISLHPRLRRHMSHRTQGRVYPHIRAAFAMASSARSARYGGHTAGIPMDIGMAGPSVSYARE